MNDSLCWYVLLNEGMFIGYTTSEYIANEYKNSYDLSDISIVRYDKPKEEVERIILSKHGCVLDEHTRIKAVTTPNERLVVLTSQTWIDDCIYGGIVDDISHDIDELIISLYNIADFLDYFVDGDKLRVIIKIMIIKYIRQVMSVYYDGQMFNDPPVDTLYALAYNNAIPIIKHLKEDL